MMTNEHTDPRDAEIVELRAENDRLRAVLGNSNANCIYCKLPRKDWASCPHGFPGCGRADDAMLCPHVGAELESREEIAELRGLLENCAMLFEALNEGFVIRAALEAAERASEGREMKTPEGKVKDEIKAYLKSIGAYYFMPVQTGYGAATVDILACVKGRFIGIEVKRPGGVPTPRQNLIMQQIEAADGVGCCVDSVELLKTVLNDPL